MCVSYFSGSEVGDAEQVSHTWPTSSISATSRDAPEARIGLVFVHLSLSRQLGCKNRAKCNSHLNWINSSAGKRNSLFLEQSITSEYKNKYEVWASSSPPETKEKTCREC